MPHPTDIGDWLRNQNPKLHVPISPSVRNTMLQDPLTDVDVGRPKFESSFRKALMALTTTGCRVCEQIARAELLSMDPPADGVGRSHIEVRWGEIARCVDFPSRSLRIGDLYYSAFDLGDAITVPSQLQKALGLPGKVETDKCVPLHIAASYEREEQNFPKIVPNKTRVGSLAAQLRQVEYQQGAQCVERIKQRHTRREYEMWSQAHDVMTPNRDRQFREIPLFLQRGMGNIKDMALRIIDIEQVGQEFIANLHVFGPNTDNEISTDMTLCVWKERMRVLLPSAETTPKSWSKWQHCFHSVHTYEWIEWGCEL